MKAYHNVIVKTNRTYIDKIGSIHLDVNRDDVEYINREVEVVDAPEYTPLKKGDKLIIHHNIVRQRIGIHGELLESDYFIKEGYYNCPLTEIFLIKRHDKWEALNPFVFIKPIKYKTVESNLLLTNSILEEMEDNYKGYNKEQGVIKYINPELIELGLKEGDTIIFSRDSEYEFTIDGELLYKMSTSDILAKME